MTDLESATAKADAAPAQAEEPTRNLPPPAQRALAEAASRRAAAKSHIPPEFNGRGGLDPVRYGDWEVKGLAVDF